MDTHNYHIDANALSAEACKSKEDVVSFLFDRLTLYTTTQDIETIDNESWVVVSGFRRWFYYHNVFVNTASHEYAFHVSDGDLYEYRFDGFPNFGRYNSYGEMIDGVADRYVVLWKLDPHGH